MLIAGKQARTQGRRAQHRAIGDVLRTARLRAGVSQFELALRLGVSQRHLSFVESGRSRPGRDLILIWMDETGAIESIRNAALLRAGFSAGPDAGDERPPVMEFPAGVHERVLDAHDPWPGLIFNADWRMLRVNAGADWLFRQIMPEFLGTVEDGKGPWDMIRGIAHPGGLLSCMPSPAAIGAHLLGQLRIEQIARPALAHRVDALERALFEAHPGMQALAGGKTLEPGLDLEFDTCFGRLRFFTVQSVFKLPQDVVPTIVRTGLWYPGDPHTREVMLRHVPREEGGTGR